VGKREQCNFLQPDSTTPLSIVSSLTSHTVPTHQSVVEQDGERNNVRPKERPYSVHLAAPLEHVLHLPIERQELLRVYLLRVLPVSRPAEGTGS
jgi:hypothetical protein